MNELQIFVNHVAGKWFIYKRGGRKTKLYAKFYNSGTSVVLYDTRTRNWSWTNVYDIPTLAEFTQVDSDDLAFIEKVITILKLREQNPSPLLDRINSNCFETIL